MGGGDLDDIWDVHNCAYVHVETQAGVSYHCTRASVSDLDEESRVREGSRKRRVEPPSEVTVRVIRPVTDGGVLALTAQRDPQADVRPVVATLDRKGGAHVKQSVGKLEGEDAAATGIHMSENLRYMEVVKIVKEELADIKQERKLQSDVQERLRWTKCGIEFLPRLDTLEVERPDVRLRRKELMKERIQIMEKIDSMSAVLAMEEVELKPATQQTNRPSPDTESDYIFSSSLL